MDSHVRFDQRDCTFLRHSLFFSFLVCELSSLSSLVFLHLTHCHGFMFSVCVNMAPRRAAILSLSAPAPPFQELMVLWDFLIAFGMHWNVLAVTAQVLAVRDKIMQATDHPKHVLDYRKWPALNARVIVTMMINMMQSLPKVCVCDLLVRCA
jgi:hypothetical protein